jgi:hypothetical protein
VTTNAVLDASVLTALFDGHDLLFQLLQESEKGASRLILPAVAVAEAETSLRAGYNGWSLLFFSPGVEVVGLDQSTAVALGNLDGSLGARHARHEANAVGATLVTRCPGDYSGLPGSLLVV